MSTRRRVTVCDLPPQQRVCGIGGIAQRRLPKLDESVANEELNVNHPQQCARTWRPLRIIFYCRGGNAAYVLHAARPVPNGARSRCTMW
jgi:hypothetical protein